jgi:hypothetical protein
MFVSASTYLDAIFLLLGDNSDRSKAMVKEFLDLSDKGKNKKEMYSQDDELIECYRGLIKSVINENITQENQTASKMLLLKVKSNEVLKSHPVVRDLLTDILTNQEAITDKQVDKYLKSIRNAILLAEIDNTARKVFAKTKLVSEIHDVEEQESELSRVSEFLNSSLKNIEAKRTMTNTKASETYVSLSDTDSIMRAIDTFMDRNIRGIITTGLQGLNKALGDRRGIGLGETTVFAAPSHNYKTGMLVSFLIWATAYNSFKQVVEPGKKAMIYFISLENEVSQNIMDVFKALYGRVEKKKVDVTTLSKEFITQWLMDYFGQFDVEVFIDRYTPHEFSFSRFTQRYNAFTELGYHIVVVDLDYMSEARGLDPGDTVSSTGRRQMISENYLKFPNHAKQCGYALITGHQLNRSADEEGQKKRYAVKTFNPSMMAESSDVMRAIDILFFLKLENNVDNHKFLTAINRKNRYCKDTKEADKFFAYPFTEFGIMDDIDDLPQFVTDIDAWGTPQGASDANILEAALF